MLAGEFMTLAETVDGALAEGEEGRGARTAPRAPGGRRPCTTGLSGTGLDDQGRGLR